MSGLRPERTRTDKPHSQLLTFNVIIMRVFVVLLNEGCRSSVRISVTDNEFAIRTDAWRKIMGKGEEQQ